MVTVALNGQWDRLYTICNVKQRNRSPLTLPESFWAPVLSRIDKTHHIHYEPTTMRLNWAVGLRLAYLMMVFWKPFIQLQLPPYLIFCFSAADKMTQNVKIDT